MKVNIYETCEVSEVQRIHIANVLDKSISKRPATRQELKDFVWGNGKDWEIELDAQYRLLQKRLNSSAPDGKPDVAPADDDEDLEDLI